LLGWANEYYHLFVRSGRRVDIVVEEEEDDDCHDS